MKHKLREKFPVRKKNKLPGKAAAFLFAITVLLFPAKGPAMPTDNENNHGVPVNLTFTDTRGNPVDMRNNTGRLTVLLFFDPAVTAQKSRLVYARVLDKKYKAHGLTVIGISSRERERLAELHNRGKFTFPFIPDPGKIIYETFNIKEYRGGTVVMDAEGKITFSTPFLLENESLRQLVEKKLSGKIAYEFTTPPPNNMFQLNRKIPDIPLSEMTSGKIKYAREFPGDYLLVTFFSSVCSVCKSGKRIAALKSIQAELKDNPRFKAVLVFLKPIDSNDVAGWEKNIPMPFEKYFSDNIFSDEEIYITDDSLKRDPMTLLLDKQRKVIFLEEIDMPEEVVVSRTIRLVTAGSQSSQKESSK